MVLVKTLKPEEVSRHKTLIHAYFRKVLHRDDVLIEFYDNGSEKGIYKVRTGDEAYVAAAANIDRAASLFNEYSILRQLYGAAPEFFPRPIAHYTPENMADLGDLFIMEFLPHLNLMRFDKSAYPRPVDFQRDLAYELGRTLAIVNAKTGRYSSDPHDGNVLVQLDAQQRLELKFCDANQFRVGSIEDTARAILVNKGERPESFRFISQFRNGMADGMNASLDMPVGEAWAQLDFMREYNDIFPRR